MTAPTWPAMWWVTVGDDPTERLALRPNGGMWIYLSTQGWWWPSSNDEVTVVREAIPAGTPAGDVVVLQRSDLRPPPWDDDEAQTGLTCDWGFCGGMTVAERRAHDYPGEEWLPVCLDHLTGPPVTVDPTAVNTRCRLCGVDHSATEGGAS